MVTADNRWPLFYQGLQQFCQPPENNATAVTIELTLEQSSKLTSVFLQLAQQNSASVIAQLNLTPQQLPNNIARLIKTLALGFIFSRSYGWSSQRSAQLLQAIVMPGAFYQHAPSSQQALLQVAKAMQHYNKQHPLLPLLVAGCNAGRHPPWQLHPDGPLLALVNQLALQLLPTTGKQLSLEQLLQKYLIEQTGKAQTNWFGVLQRLSQDKALPGRFAREPDTSKSTQHYWFISGIAHTEHKQPIAVYARQFDPASKTIASEVQQRPLTTLKLLSPQYFRDPGWLQLLELAPDILPPTAEFPLQLSMAQSQHGQLAMLSLTAQVKKLETQPLISQFLQHAAQQISRQQLPVRQLRHAISMLGQDALSDWVAQAELHQYCCRLAHPHQHWLEQLQQCLQQALMLVSNAINRPLTLSTAGVIARCATVSLWQQPVAANVALARHVQGQLLLGQMVQQHIWQATDYPVLFSQLLTHYQQPPWAAAAQQWHQQPVPRTMLLRLSWQLSLAVFCASTQNQQRLVTLLPVASAQLGVPEQAAGFWQQQLMANSHCYYPLPAL